MCKQKFIAAVSTCFIALLFFCASCKKSSSDSGTTVVEYQVSATNSSNISINYNNVLESIVQVNAQSSWVFDVTVDKKPFHAYVQGTSTSPTSQVQTTCTVTILVNGNNVKTSTISSNSSAVATADYTVQ